MMRPFVSLIAPVLVGALLALACSDDDDSGAADGGAGTGGQAGTAGSGGGAGSGGAGGSPSDGGSDADAGPEPEHCPGYEPGVSRGTLASSLVVEASGLVVSRRNARVLWTHNDKGNAPLVYALRDDGADLGHFTLGNIDAGPWEEDWEDIALGPGPEPDRDYLYIGDIGSNEATRTSVLVHRFPEPSLDAEAGPRDEPVAYETLLLEYPDGAHNAETLLVDPLSGDAFIVTKQGASVPYGETRVYRAPAPVSSGVLEHVTTLTFGSPPLEGGTLVTGGDIAVSGKIVLRTYESAFLWRRPTGSSVAEALAGEPCAVPLVAEPQGEAIGFAPDESGYFTLSEREDEDDPLPALYFFARAP